MGNLGFQPGIEPTSLAFEGGFFTTGPRGKSLRISVLPSSLPSPLTSGKDPSCLCVAPFPRWLLSPGKAARWVSDLHLLCPLPGHQHQQSHQHPGGPREREARPAYPFCGHSSGPLGEARSVRRTWGRWIWGAVGIADGPMRRGPHCLVRASLGPFQTLSPAWGRPPIVLGHWAQHGMWGTTMPLLG